MDKTLLLSEIFPPVHGGSGRWFWELYTRLPKEQCYFAVGNSEKAAEFDRTHDLQLRRFNLSSSEWGISSAKGCSFYWRLWWSLRKYIKNNGIEQIHCGRCLPEGFLGYMLSRFLGIPLVCYVHGEDIEAALTSKELTFIIQRVLKHSSKIICNSSNTKKLLEVKLHLGGSKIQVINPGVDASKFIPKKRDSSVRQELGWGNRTTILTVGRLQKRKGQDMLIKALPQIKERFPDINYVIVGDGEERENLEKLSDTLGLNEHVTFLSEVDDDKIVKCYQQCDLFALANRTHNGDIEGFGMVLVEAQSCGKAVLAGDSGGTRETMKIGETGIIADCTNETSLAEALLDMLSDKENLERMGINGRQHIENELDWPSLVRKAEQTFLTVSRNKSKNTDKDGPVNTKGSSTEIDKRGNY